MTIDRAIEILNPEHRENYDGLDEVNEACRMGMEALKRQRWIPCSERLPERGESVLFWPAHGDGRCRSGFYDYTSRSGATWFTTWDYCTDYVASHWMPTPEPPEEGGSENAAD